MPDIRAPVDKEAVEKDYLRGMKYKDLAEKYGVALNTIKSWKQRYAWNKKSVRLKDKKVCIKKNAPKKEKQELKHEIIVGLENEELTEMQRLFCIYYVKTFNQTLSAVKAGYEPSRAHITGSELVRNSKCKKYIRELKGTISKEIFIDEMDVLNKYIKIAFSDISDFVSFGSYKEYHFTEDGKPIMDVQGDPLYHTVSFQDFKNSDEVDGSLISEIKTSRQGASIKLDDRLKALDWLSKFFEMNPEHNYRKEFDTKKLQLERERFDHVKKMDEIKEW